MPWQMISLGHPKGYQGGQWRKAGQQVSSESLKKLVSTVFYMFVDILAELSFQIDFRRGFRATEPIGPPG